MSYSKSGFLWKDSSTMNVFTVATYAFAQKMENILVKYVIKHVHVLKKVPFY